MLDDAQVIGPVTTGSIAQGGVCIARYNGRVVFVRGALPDEQVMIRLTDTSKKSFWRAEVVEVLDPRPERIVPVCPIADQCGGCDFQHVALDAQRALKTTVLRELLNHRGFQEAPVVEGVGQAGLGWRTRMRYLSDGTWVGLRASRSHRIVSLPEGGCPIAHPQGNVDLSPWVSDAHEIATVVSDDGLSIVVDGHCVHGKSVVHQHVDRRYAVQATGFWQIHPEAASTLTRTVLEMLKGFHMRTALDLYCGVGLFAGALVDAGAQVTGIEFSRAAVNCARKNVPEARFIAGRLEQRLAALPDRVDAVVLDPPRSGAGKKIVEAVCALKPSRIVYVSCDPATLCRDLVYASECGYRVEKMRAFDLFPMTHHMETLCLLTPSSM